MPETPVDPKWVQAAFERDQTVPASDGAISDIVRHSEGGEVVAARDRAYPLLREGVTDIRVILAYLQGVFSALGPASLEGVFAALQYALTDGFERVFPSERKVKTFDGALTSTLRSMAQKWDLERSRAHGSPTPWTTLDQETAAHALGRSATLRAAGEAVLERCRFSEQLSAIDRHLHSAMERAPVAPAHPVAHDEDAPEAPAAHEAVDAGRPVEPSPAAVPATVAIEISPAMASLIARLRAFEVLVGRGEFNRAAVVAEDVRRSIETFDPTAYLPAFFAQHFALLSEHIARLSPLWQAAHTPEWRVLEQHCKVDLEGFVGRP